VISAKYVGASTSVAEITRPVVNTDRRSIRNDLLVVTSRRL